MEVIYGKFVIKCDEVDIEHFKNSSVFYSKDIHIRINKSGTSTPRYILSLKDETFDINDWNMVVDHIDGDRLNNVRSNLRKATRQQNNMNHRISDNNTTGITGIQKEETRPGSFTWCAVIGSPNSSDYFERFRNKSLKKAAKWRFDKEIEMFGEYSRYAGMTFEEYWGDKEDVILENKRDELIKCDKCGDEYKAINYPGHYKSCGVEHKCVCGKSFPIKAKLRRHQEGEKSAKADKKPKGCEIFKKQNTLEAQN